MAGAFCLYGPCPRHSIVISFQLPAVSFLREIGGGKSEIGDRKSEDGNRKSEMRPEVGGEPRATSCEFSALSFQLSAVSCLREIGGRKWEFGRWRRASSHELRVYCYQFSVVSFFEGISSDSY